MKKLTVLLLMLLCVLMATSCFSADAEENAPLDDGKENNISVTTDAEISEPETYKFEAQYIDTDGYIDGKSYPYHVVINSKQELDEYYETNKDVYNFEGWTTVYGDKTVKSESFADACKKYDDAYFEKQNLVLIVLEEPSGSIRHEITDVRRHRDENGTLSGWDITIDRIIPTLVATHDMAQWHLFLEVQEGKVIKSEDEIRITVNAY